MHRTVSGPKVIADLDRAHSRSLTSDDDLFRPLEAGISRRQRGQVLASKRHVRKEKTAVQDTDDQFFELWYKLWSTTDIILILKVVNHWNHDSNFINETQPFTTKHMTVNSNVFIHINSRGKKKE